jgi:hypothetical protein
VRVDSLTSSVESGSLVCNPQPNEPCLAPQWVGRRP